MAPKRSLGTWVLWAIFASVAVCVAFLIIGELQDVPMSLSLFYAELVSWPGAILLMALDDGSNSWTWHHLPVIIASITANIFLYAACASLLWLGRYKYWLFAMPVVAGLPVLWWRLLTL